MNFYKENVLNTTAPLTLVPNTLAIVNSGCTSHFLGPTTPCTNKSSTSNGVLVGLPNGSSIRASHTALLPFPQLPFGARQSNIFPALGERNLISIGQICDHGFSALFTAKDVSLVSPTATLKGTRNTNNGLYYMDLQCANQPPVTPIPPPSPFSNNVHTLSTKSDIFQYLHRLSFSPVVSTWSAAITSGIFTTWPGLTSSLVRKHLLKSLATAKGRLRQDRKNVRCTRITSPTTPISYPPVMTNLLLPLQEPGFRTQMAYLQTVKFTGKVSTDQTGRFPVTSSRGSKYLMVLYDHDSNVILAEPLISSSERKLVRATRVLHSYLSAHGLTPQYQMLDNECPVGLTQFLRDSSVGFKLVPPHLHRTNAAERAIQTYKDHLVASLSS